jgi:NAD(P)-dependent dehydrogenase (short-subunit alcohol dehydrogenase family)
MTTLSLRSNVVIVTGGSRGIGAATSLLAAQLGCAVCVNYVRNENAARTVTDGILNIGGRAISVQADVSEEADVERLFATCDELLGTPTALVNNAGILETQMRVEDMSAGRVERIFRTNVIGTFLCARAAVRRMSTANGGSGGAIVNVSSGASRLGSANEYVDYAASKGAIDSFTIGLSKEVAAEGIRVNAVRPGFIYTDMHTSGGEPNRVDRLKDQIPMKRGGQADEVAQAIIWLLSENASYVTGSFIDMAGGR